MRIKIQKNEEIINRILNRGTYKVISSKDLKKRLEEGKQLIIKYGIDPTSSNIHLGRASTIQYLNDLSQLGHKIVFIVGDFTAKIGDTSDKIDLRKDLTSSEIENNFQTYKKQLSLIMDLSKVEYRYNSEWLKNINLENIIDLTSIFTVSQMIERDNFNDRFKNNKPIRLKEFLYPIIQGYDSVAINADVELGGSDQLFNLLTGRTIQNYLGLRKQNIITKKLLIGTDGRKMSSSWKNVINITDTPNNMYAKLMRISDESLYEYFELATRIPDKELKNVKLEIDNANGKSIMKLKKDLAFEITKMYSSSNEAIKASKHFEKTVQNKDIDKEDIVIIKTTLKKVKILDLLSDVTGQIPSRAEGRRMIQSGGVYIDNKRIKEHDIDIQIKNGIIIKVGKRNITKIEKI